MSQDYEIEFEDDAAANKFREMMAKDPTSAKNLIAPTLQTKSPEVEIPKHAIAAPQEDGTLEKIGKGYVAPFVRNLARGATAGLTEPVAAGISAGIGKFIQPEKSLGQLYDENRDRQRKSLDAEKKASPVSSFAGNVAGIAAPTGVFNQLYGGATKIAEKAIPLAGKAAQYGRYALQGGLGGLGYGGVNTVSENAMGNEEKWSPTRDFAMGALFDAGGRALFQGGKALVNSNAGQAVKDFVSPVTERVKGALTGWGPLEGIKEGAQKARVGKFERGFEKLAENAGAVDDVATSAALRENVGSAKGALSENYEKLVKPVLKAHAEKPAQVEDLRRAIVDVFDQHSLLDPKGNFNLSSLEKLPAADPTRKMFETLSEYSNTLQQNPTLGELNLIKKSLQNLAKFDKASGSPLADVSKHISSVAKQSLENNVKNYAGEMGLDQFQKGMAEYASKITPLNKLEKVVGSTKADDLLVKAAEKVPSAIRNLGGSALSSIVERVPEVKASLGKVILNQIYTKATNPKQLTKIIDQYGRENLSNLLDQGTIQTLQKLEKADQSIFKRGIDWLAGEGPVKNAISGAYKKNISPYFGSRSLAPLISPQVGDSI